MFCKIPKISYSLLSNLGGDQSLKSVVAAIAYVGVDYIHYDVSENEKTLHLHDVERFIRLSPLPFDIHLCVTDPLAAIGDLRLRPQDKFSLHVENKLSLEQIQTLKNQLSCQFGLAINIETAIEDVFDFVPQLDFVLFMSATPGVSAGTFDERVVNKIKSFKSQYSDICLHVDGGINRLSAALVRDIGIDVIVSGSYILSGKSQTNQVANLFGRNLLLAVTSIMHQGDQLPCVRPDAPISVVAKEISVKKVGCTCVLDDDGHLLGFITDGDLRRALIKSSNLANYKAQDLMKEKPFAVNPDQSLLSVFRTIDDQGLGFAAVPVIESSGRCVGVFRLQDVLFTDLL